MNEQKKPTKRRISARDFIIWFLIAGLIVAAYLYVSNKSSHDFKLEANKFFAAAKNNNYLEAINYLSNNLKSTMTPIQLERFINRMATVDYKSTRWETRSISDEIVELLGETNTQNNDLPSSIDVIFIMSENDWKILSIKTDLASVSKEEMNNSIPPLDSLNHLATASLNLIANSIKIGNYFDLYKDISRTWRMKTSESDLQNKFSQLSNQNIDLTPSESFGIVFSEVPEITQKGSLVLKGYYPTNSVPISFVLSYKNEDSLWVLDDVDMSTQ